MANNIENATYTSELNQSLPQGPHSVGITDDHLNLIKACIKNTLLGNTSDPYDVPLRVGPRALNALSDTLNLSSFVTISGDQTITGAKDFTEWVTATGGILGASGGNMASEYNGYTIFGNEILKTAMQSPNRDDLVAVYGENIEPIIHTGNARDLLVNTFLPVGHILMRGDATSPNSLYPGTTWVRIAEGRYLMGAGQGTDRNGLAVLIPNGQVDVGDYTVSLNAGNLPQHDHHMQNMGSTSASSGDSRAGLWGASVWYGDAGLRTDGGTGTADAFSNSPPGYAMYVWQRVA